MRRWALRLEYDGRGFVGWQRQANGLSVQEVLELAASRLCAGVPVESTVAGRTDAGVHATAQVACLALPDRLDARAVREALNFHMKPHSVVVLEAAKVLDPDWSPRFSAIGRAYRYLILNRPARPATLAGFVWHVKIPLDVAAMHRAAQTLIGRHDFSSFRASSCQAASPVRTLDRLDVRREHDTVIIEAEARSFLHHQVRNMVGTLRVIGDGRWPESRMAQALAACNRSSAGPTAPPDGLTLVGVRYPVDPFSEDG